MTTDVNDSGRAAGPSDRGASGAGSRIEKAPTGIPGFDVISRGGVPRGRVTLVVGGPGSGKTLFALESLVNGARLHHEAGVFVAFEENSRQIVANAATFGWDLPALEREKLFFLDARLSPATVRGGDFDLGALLAALGAKCDELGARRIVFDGLDVLLTLLDDPAAERREVYRLHEWLRDRELTGLMTAKAGDADRAMAERYAFMQFMVDCVVSLHHRMNDRVSHRSLRIQKYRGSGFEESEFPMIIADGGIEVSTFGSPTLDYPAYADRVSTGVPRLDAMLGGGYYRGSSTLISGAPGTAKSTLAGAFVGAACERGGRSLWVSFDESAEQIVRNLASVGIRLAPHLEAGRLVVHAVRTEARSAEEHLLDLRRTVERLAPTALVIDPISALTKTGGNLAAVHASLRMLDLARSRGVTVVCTSLVAEGENDAELTSTQLSTIADNWLHLAYLVKGGERNRTLTVVKSRGTRHSNQVRELLLSDEGVSLADVYTAGGEVLVGTARWERELEVEEEERRRAVETARRRRELELAEAELGARIAALQRELETRRAEAEALAAEETEHRDRLRSSLGELRRRRLGAAWTPDGDDAGRAAGDGAAGRRAAAGAPPER